AVLPRVWQWAAGFAIATLLVLVVRPSRSFCLGLLSFTALLLPWFPAENVPAPFLIWTDHAALAAVAAISVALLATHWRTATPRLLARPFLNPQSAPWVAFALAGALMVTASGHMAPTLPAGDEPEYMVVMQSLLLDRDLQTTNNYERKDYLEFVPVASHSMGDYLQPGVDGKLYSIHMPALPLFVAPAFAFAGYFGVNIFLA